MNRLPVEVFDLPVAELRRGYRSAVYFGRAKRILEAELPNHEVIMQVFQKGNSVACGIDQALAVLKLATGTWNNDNKAEKAFDHYLKLKLGLRAEQYGDAMMFAHNMRELAYVQAELNELWLSLWGDLEVSALHDGDEIVPWEPVIQIKGRLADFVHLESVYLGILARQTKVATNVRKVCKAANGKPMLFFADRFDHFSNQGSDGHAAKIGGATGVATDAMSAWWGEKGLGTMPHALIAAFDGDVVAATTAFEKHVPGVDLIALVDFTNDCVLDSLRCLDEFGERLWGVRLDTSETMIDPAVAASGQMGDFKPTGVNPVLVQEVRHALNESGGQHVKIIVSGGFDVEKITTFERLGSSVDAYAVGSSLLKGSIDYTADCVWPVAKEGRRLRDASRLSLVS